MALFEPYKGLSTQLNSLPIKDGQLIVTTDTKNLYIDTSSSTRIRINDDYEKQSFTGTINVALYFAPHYMHIFI